MLFAVCKAYILEFFKSNVTLTVCSKKIDTPTHIDYLVNSQRSFSILPLAHSWQICDKTVIKDPTTRKTRISKIARIKAQQRQTKRAITKENVIVVDEMVLSQ